MSPDTLALIGTLATLIIKGLFDIRARQMDRADRETRQKTIVAKIDENSKVNETAIVAAQEAVNAANHVTEKFVLTHQVAATSIADVLAAIAELRQEALVTRDIVHTIHGKLAKETSPK